MGRSDPCGTPSANGRYFSTAVVHGEVLGVTLTFLVPDDDEHVMRPDIVLGQEGRDLLVGMPVFDVVGAARGTALLVRSPVIAGLYEGSLGTVPHSVPPHTLSSPASRSSRSMNWFIDMSDIEMPGGRPDAGGGGGAILFRAVSDAD
jgi:hypothetical protein